MSTFKNLLSTSLCVLTLAISSHTLGQESTPIAQINGKDVALSADTAIVSFDHGPTLQGQLLNSGIDFILVDDRVTVFGEDDVKTVCGIIVALSDDISLTFNGDERTCSE